MYDPSFCSNVFQDLNKNWDSQICAGIKIERNICAFDVLVVFFFAKGEILGGRDSCQGDR